MSNLAFLLVITSVFFHAIWNFAAKKVAGNLSVIWIGLVIADFVMIPFLFYVGIDKLYVGEMYPYVIASGILHAIYFYALAKSYEYGDISIVYPIARGCGAGGTLILGYVILQEVVSVNGALGVFAIILGIILLGYKNGANRRGVLFALLVGLMIMGYSLVSKVAVGLAHPLAYLFCYTVVYTLLLAPYVFLKKNSQLQFAYKSQKKYSCIIGIGAVGTSLLIMFALQLAQVGYVVALRQLSVAIGAALGFFLLKEKVTIKKLFGIFVVVIGMILIKIA